VRGRYSCRTQRPIAYGMRQEIQWYLVEALANARSISGTRRERPTEVTMAGFAGSLSALRYVDEISQDEQLEWMERMREALGITIKPLGVLVLARMNFPYQDRQIQVHFLNS